MLSMMNKFIPLTFILISFLTDGITARESLWKFNFNQETAGKDGAVVDMTSYMFAESFVTINVACQSAILGGPGGSAQYMAGQEIEISWMLVELDCEENINSFSSRAVKKILDEPSACEIITNTPPPSPSNPTPAPTEFSTALPISSLPPRHKRRGDENGNSHDPGQENSNGAENKNSGDAAGDISGNSGSGGGGSEGGSADNGANKDSSNGGNGNANVNNDNNNKNNDIMNTEIKTTVLSNDNGSDDDHSNGPANFKVKEGFDVKGNRIKGDKEKDKATSRKMDVVIEAYVQFSYSQKKSCTTKQDTIVVIRLQDETKLPYHRITTLKNGSECKLVKLDQPASKSNHTLSNQVAKAWSDGRYRLFLQVKATNDVPYQAAVVIEMRDYANFLSAREWPMLPVTGMLAILYLVIATFWIFYWARSQEHTKKIHIIIGVVAVAGAMGSTLSFADYSVRNADGLGVSGIRWMGALLSTLQDSLTYLMLMVVSTGYGINRPNISLEWIAGMLGLSIMNFLAGVAYLVAFDETIRAKYDMIPAAFKLIAAVYAIINILITGWIMIFSIYTLVYLIQRRHSSATKLRLFTVFMIACVSVFTVQFITSSYEISQGLFTACRKDWKYEWVGASLSQVEVFILLTVLMWLWRPTDENKSYAFQPVSTNDSIQLDDDSADETGESILLNEF